LKCDKIVQDMVTLKGSKQQGEFERQQSCETRILRSKHEEEGVANNDSRLLEHFKRALSL
jgi:hypothetical protein